MTVITWFFACLISYVLGCVNIAYYWVRLLHGVDVRHAGSGNAGARNVGRIYGISSFVIVLLLDGTLGALAVVIGLIVTGTESLLPGCCALMTIIGHVFPVQLDGRGGKGLAKALGALTMLLITEAIASLCLAMPCMFVLLAFTHRSNIRQWRNQEAHNDHF